MTPAIFFDRDGVLIEDVHLLTRPEQVRILPGVAEALSLFRKAGFKLIVISNQTVVSRGLATEADVAEINTCIEDRLRQQNAPQFDAVYICPHHPKATLERYRQNCECRKPRPGLILQAARENEIDLARSYMIGDRISDIIAGARAGCRTVLVTTGQHTAAPIESADPMDLSIKPDFTCEGLFSAAQRITQLK